MLKLLKKIPLSKLKKSSVVSNLLEHKGISTLTSRYTKTEILLKKHNLLAFSAPWVESCLLEWSADNIKIYLNSSLSIESFVQLKILHKELKLGQLVCSVVSCNKNLDDHHYTVVIKPDFVVTQPLGENAISEVMYHKFTDMLSFYKEKDIDV
jgi:hypothetical protein